MNKPHQKPKHKLQLNNSFNKLEYLKMKFLGRLNMDPYLRIHIKPTQEINSIAIK